MEQISDYQENNEIREREMESTLENELKKVCNKINAFNGAIEGIKVYEGGCSCKRIYAGEDVVKFEVTCFLKPGLYHP